MKPWTGIRIDHPSIRETKAHQHDLVQLFFVREGLLSVRTPTGVWMVPPGCLGWIHSNVRHSAKSAGPITGWSVYCPAPRKRSRAEDVYVLRNSHLLKALLERLVEMGSLITQRPLDKSLASLILNEITAADIQPWGLPFPTSKGLIRVAESILKEGPQGKNIAAWSKEAGMSVRSFSRHFRSETGKSFEQWRTAATHQKAIELISQGENITGTALALGYESVSAFIASFRRYFGKSPTKFLANESLEPHG